MNLTKLFQSRFSGRRGRELKEYATAYLMLFPAVFLIFVFGIFPVFFALYVSLHKWQLIQGEFRGLRNYITAMDNLTYVGLFALAIISFWIVSRSVLNSYREIRELRDPRAWLTTIPAAFHAAAVLAFFRWFYYQLPEFLGIARKLRGQERTNELFIRLLKEAFYFETVYPFWQSFVQIFLIGILVSLIGLFLWRNNKNLSLQYGFVWNWLGLAIGGGLLYVTFNAVNTAYATAFELGEDPGIWPQLITIASGLILLLLSWQLWRSAEKQDTMWGLGFRLFASITLTMGAVVLIMEIPSIVATGDPDMWEGLKVTFFFSAGTVPIQLTIALFLAVLLFQKLRGSGFFRILFFIPYITPGIASAAVFKEIFSSRISSPANLILSQVGIEQMKWLEESDGIIEILGNIMSFSVPDWATGPSLALAVIIMHSIWTYVGYNTVIYLAGLGNISAELTEAAEIDGANKWNVFRYITFPLLSPTTYFLSLLGVIGTFKAFNTIWVLREAAALGTTDPFSVLIFDEFFTNTRFGYASALAFILFAIIISLTLINNKIQGSRVFYG